MLSLPEPMLLCLLIPTIASLFEGGLGKALFPPTKRGVSKIGQGLGLWPSVGESGSGWGEGRQDAAGMGRQRQLTSLPLCWALSYTFNICELPESSLMLF